MSNTPSSLAAIESMAVDFRKKNGHPADHDVKVDAPTWARERLRAAVAEEFGLDTVSNEALYDWFGSRHIYFTFLDPLIIDF